MANEVKRNVYIEMSTTSKTLMMGGAKFQNTVLEWTRQSSNLFNTLFYGFLLLFAVYADKVPPAFRYQLSSFMGRSLLLVLLYVLFHFHGLIAALLFAVGIAILWSNRPIQLEAGWAIVPSSPLREWNRPLAKPVELVQKEIEKEGFQDVKVSEKEDENKWFVEEVLEETPRRIVEDRVHTNAVQD